MALGVVNQLLQLSTNSLYTVCHHLRGEVSANLLCLFITTTSGTVTPLAYYRCYAGCLNPWIVFQLTANQGNSPEHVRVLKWARFGPVRMPKLELNTSCDTTVGSNQRSSVERF